MPYLPGKLDYSDICFISVFFSFIASCGFKRFCVFIINAA